jgi:hypothetical protein
VAGRSTELADSALFWERGAGRENSGVQHRLVIGSSQFPKKPLDDTAHRFS